MLNDLNSNNIFTLSFKVRDYECDMQGIVNNSVYLNYLEHTRHEFLDSIGLNFKKLTQREIYLVAIESQQKYRKSLESGDDFSVSCQMMLESKLRIKFIQEIYHAEKGLILQSSLIGVAINSSKKPILIDSFLKSNAVSD
ncbi:acyl-CoA thioesterase [Candidatus Berkiella cookevillensis]|uniref:Acyl-CoA thioesterase n=1 Tax=Candidatus Berkiella cookevillensis TaxID=437022 RepID=A0A0Q9YR09_9GAMM|nr:acyl-CoA thioesterase [Candidatus Berkiella cookevillensis]MCS5709303.1 acyl-CoA thioesterase [Candidatus Berkiella cookevillensis]